MGMRALITGHRGWIGSNLTELMRSEGHEVEGYEVLAPSFEGILIGRVETVAPHPDADKVRLCTVDTGSGPDEIICGAWNFEAGAIVPVAPAATALS